MKASFKAMWLLASLGILMVLAAGCNDTLTAIHHPCSITFRRSRNAFPCDHVIDQSASRRRQRQ